MPIQERTNRTVAHGTRLLPAAAIVDFAPTEDGLSPGTRIELVHGVVGYEAGDSINVITRLVTSPLLRSTRVGGKK